MKKEILKTLILFTIGGSSYVIIEMIFTKNVHFDIFLLGGSCFYFIGLINENINKIKGKHKESDQNE